MTLHDLILANRSYRRFDEKSSISRDELVGLIELARFSASARNAQPLKYLLSWDLERNSKIFPCLSWAGYLKDWPGPEKGERPSAYIVMLGDSGISTNYFCDPGIAAQSMLLGAVEKGYGGCIIATINREVLRAELKIPAKFEIIQILALGKPVEKVLLETVKPDGDIKYWRDWQQVHHVPKRPMNELIVDF